jgi:pimeloyl-ACP methyl ester carboxylesterase
VLCSEYGLAQGGCGLPVVFLHGNLNSRLLAPAWAHSQELTAGAGCRVLALDRPGE